MEQSPAPKVVVKLEAGVWVRSIQIWPGLWERGPDSHKHIQTLPPRTMCGHSIPFRSMETHVLQRAFDLPLFPTPGQIPCWPWCQGPKEPKQEGGFLKSRLRIRAKGELWDQQALAPKQSTLQTHRDWPNPLQALTVQMGKLRHRSW